MLISQLVKLKKPTVEQQIDFVNQARTKKLVLNTSQCIDMFRAIEENLVAVGNLNRTFTRILEEGSKEVSNG